VKHLKIDDIGKAWKGGSNGSRRPWFVMLNSGLFPDGQPKLFDFPSRDEASEFLHKVFEYEIVVRESYRQSVMKFYGK
jgi:hypothetical protein